MKRTELKRTTPLVAKKPMARGSAQLARSPIKKKARKKIEGHHDKRMLTACKGEPCYMEVPGVCRGELDRDTVVPAHGNWADMGKGAGLKAADRYTVPACLLCHSWLDVGTDDRETKRSVFLDALSRWAPVRARKLNLKEEG